MDIAVIGLGKLGLPLACLHAYKHHVYGVDQNEDAVSRINAGDSPIAEPGLKDLLIRAIDSGQFTAYTDYSVVRGTDASLIIVPTPSQSDGAFTSEYVIDSVTKIGEAIRGQDKRHVVVVCSTVMPGECDGPIRQALEKASGFTVGDDLGLIYSPEFIALGSVLLDMSHPDMILIGESDRESGDVYEELARSIAMVKSEGPVPVKRMSLTSAELTKISINAYVTMKISFANSISELAERLPGANATDITQAIGLDRRIGSYYVRPGGPFGGPCFPRDNRAFSLVGEQVGLPMPLPKATDAINSRQVLRVLKKVLECGRSDIGIVGLSYKLGTPVIEESFGMNIIQALTNLPSQSRKIRVYDPLVKTKPDGILDRVYWHHSAADCFGDDILTILTLPYPKVVEHFHTIIAQDDKKHSIVVDVWDCIPHGPWDDTHIIRMGNADAN